MNTEAFQQRPGLPAIFLAFLRLGCTAFGGPAMIPYIRRMAVERRKWISPEDFELGMAAAQAIPGATAMQVAAWAGARARGVPGCLAAYLGFGLPAFLLMLTLSVLYFSARELPVVAALLGGLRVVVCALVANAAWDFARRYLISPLKALLALAAAVSFFFQLHPIGILVVICLAAALLFRDEGQARAPRQQGRKASRAAPLKVAVVIALGLGLLWAVDDGLFDLAAMMARIDCFAFGGGYVSLPLMLHEVTSRGLMDETMLMEGIALGQVTPGPIVMTAAFVGYSAYGVLGAVVATVFVFAPSFFFVVLVEPAAGRVVQNRVVRRMLAGSLVTLVGLLAAITLRFVDSVQWGVWEGAIALAALVALRLKVDIIWVVLVGAAVSALVL